MLKKLVATLALTSLAFGSGLCFDPYNHDYGVSTKDMSNFYYVSYNRNKEIVLHNGKLQLDKDVSIKLLKYIAKGNKALVLMKADVDYLVFYVECVNGKPQTKAAEDIGSYVDSDFSHPWNVKRYPVKVGFYKDGFWTKALGIDGGTYHDPEYHCNYETAYFPYKLVEEHKTDNNPPHKNKFLPKRVCNVLVKQLGIGLP
jgi:hypothetical protein